MSSSVFPFETLSGLIEGDLYYDMPSRLMYATDASVYRELPAAVCRPKHLQDVSEVLAFCRKHGLSLVARTAGTSLAGQVVGSGMIMDFSRYMNKILEFNAEEKWVLVQPGVILDDLNDFLKPHGLFFGPETSTSNRCMIGGMVGNNACGSHSLVYGSTRDHTLEIEALLSDGTQVLFKALDNDEFRAKCVGHTLENEIYRHIFTLLSDKDNQQEILNEYPDPELKRRNTGYALDLLMNCSLFTDSQEKFNFCKLLAGSEGSLAVFSAVKLQLVPLPPPEKALVCVHLNSIEEALQANLIALKYKPVAVELIDSIVLDCTKTNISQNKNRFFILGDPACILVVEFAAASKHTILSAAEAMEADMRRQGLGYHFPLVSGKDISRVWALRKAGLGLLSNMPGDAKPVAVIEDAAVHVKKLPDFISELKIILKNLKLECVFYAHIGTGELHLRPVLNLKNPADVERFYQIARETATLVKKFRGSFSGEHGDGRLRAEFIPVILSEKIAGLLKELKHVWDPGRLLNPGKITDPASMKTSLRYSPGHTSRKLNTFFNYPEAGSFLQAVEKCNGSGDCRKPHNQGGVMCPSYHATLNEDASTRGRANILREYITHSPQKNPFAHDEIRDVLSLCLSCKACKSECPSNVDMAKYKAEAMQQYYLANGTPLRARMVASFALFYRLGSIFPGLFNIVAAGRLSKGILQSIAGFAPQRNIPLLGRFTLRKWANHHLAGLNETIAGNKKVYLFCDEFTNYNDTHTGVNAILLLNALGYRVSMVDHPESGRASLSKGLLKRAGKLARRNVEIFSGLVNEDHPLLGIEPSAILSFRNEYPVLVGKDLEEQARHVAIHTLTFEEFICREFDNGDIDPGWFTDVPRTILFHGHCHQKALSSPGFSTRMLSIPKGNTVKEIECGCCGMAGSFGFEKKNYKLSMAIGELSLFPAIRNAPENSLIAASGTSCRAQILDGTGKKAMHPVDLLYSLLKSNMPGE